MASRVKVVVSNGLGSYANLFTPRPVGDPPKMKYSIALLWDKKEAAKELKALREAIQQVAVEKWGPDAILALAGKPNKSKLKLHNPLKDGDTDKPQDEVYAGKVFFNTSTDRAPVVVDKNRAKVFEESEAYSGCIYNASLNVYCFDKAAKKGVSLGLNGVQVVAKGERLGGGAANAEDDFKEIAGGGDSKDEDLSDIM